MLKDKLLAVKTKEKKIEVEGETLIIKEMLAGEATKYESSLYSIVNGQPVLKMEGSKSKMIALCVYDQDGKRVFEDKDIALIEKMPTTLIDKLFKECSSVNGMGNTKN
jgi:hypothetical protein